METQNSTNVTGTHAREALREPSERPGPARVDDREDAQTRISTCLRKRSEEDEVGLKGTPAR